MKYSFLDARAIYNTATSVSFWGNTMTSTIIHTLRSAVLFALVFTSISVTNAGTLSTNWTLITDAPGWSKRAGLAGAVFQDKMWIMGGRHGNTRYNDVWSSSDGSNWVQETSSAPWSARHAFTCSAFADKLWVMGGKDSTFLNDVWSSTNGVDWTQVTNSAHGKLAMFTKVSFMMGCSGLQQATTMVHF